MINIIIPAYNEEDFKVKTLQHLITLKNELPIEIIVSDERRTDNTVEATKLLQVE